MGTTLASKLSGEGHDVAVVERDPARLADLADTLDVRVVAGNGATAGALRQAGAADASLVVAATESDEANFVCGRIAASMFEVPHVVVRLREPDHEEAFRALSRGDDVDIACVNPEAAAVGEIGALLEVPGALDVWHFMGGDLLVAGFPIHEGSEFAERPVLDMRLFFAETPSLVVAIHRDDHVLVPGGKETIRTGDIVYFALARSDLDAMLELMEVSREASRKLMIAGASRMGLDLARRLESSTASLVVLEPDEGRARAAAEQLSRAVVVHGSLTSERLLDEEQIERVGTFVAVGDDHETNLVAGLLAKRMGAGRAFALVDNPALANLIGETAIDAIISPRLLAIGLTLQHIPGAVVHEMAALLGDRVEVLEAEVGRGAPVCNHVIASLDLPPGLLFVAIGRGGGLRVPRGDDRVEPGDRLLVVAKSGLRSRLSALLLP